MMFRLLNSITLLCALTFALAEINDEPAKPPVRINSLQGYPQYTLFNVNNISAWVGSDGLSGYNPITKKAGILYPRGTAPVVYQDGIIWGGYVLDPDPDLPRLRVGGQSYRVGTIPGRIISPGVPQDPADPQVRVYRIRQDWETVSDAVLRREATELYQIDSSQVTQEQIDDVRYQYEKDWNDWPVEYGAPYNDMNHNGKYDPGIDEPGLARADQVIWLVINDLDEGRTLDFSGSPPIGLEVQITIWGYQSHVKLQDVIFKRYRLINKSGFPIDSMFIGQWTDADLGSFHDNLTGCDLFLDLGYCYNGYAEDDLFADFGLVPPAVGYSFVQGPIVASPGDEAIFDLKKISDTENLLMTSYVYNRTGDAIGDPISGDYEYGTLAWYNWLNGNIPTSDTLNPRPYYHWTGPDSGQPTKFPLNGDPITGTGDIDNDWIPGTRRFVINSGPFEMQPGDTQEVVIALVGGLGKSQLSSIAAMKHNTMIARFFHTNLFNIPDTPPSPKLLTSSLNGKIVLDWGSDIEAVSEMEENDEEAGYYFEGYNVYQIPHEHATREEAFRIITFDKETYPAVIMAKIYDQESGLILEKPVIYGRNSGLEYVLTLEKDHLTGQPLIDGQSYFYAVTTYRYNSEPGNPLPVTESPIVPIEVVAHRNNPGYFAELNDTLIVTHIGRSTAKVRATVANPGALDGYEYHITFGPEESFVVDTIKDHTGNVIGYDTLGIYYKWNLIDYTRNQTILHQQEISESTHALYHGLKIMVSGSRLKKLDCWYSSGVPWITGVGYGQKDWACGFSLPFSFFGSTINLEDVAPVQLVFQDRAEVEANGYASKGAVYRRDLGYAYNGIGELPMEAFDVTDPDNPRKVNICFVEDENVSQENGVHANSVWDMGWNAETVTFAQLGGREYLFIMESNYDEGADYDDDNWGPAADVLYAGWLDGRVSRHYLNNRFAINLIYHIPPTPDDTFLFTSPNPADIPVRFRLYQNYPNPFNARTTIRYWIPHSGKVTLEIYNILGQKMTTLVDGFQQQGEYFVRWNAADKASGLYIYRLSTPDKTEVRRMLLLR